MGGTVAKVSIAGPSRRSGSRKPAPSASPPSTAAVPPRRSCHGADRGSRGDRKLQQLEHGGDLLGRVRGDLTPRVEHLVAALEWIEKRPGVELGDRIEVELERRDNAEVAAAAAQRRARSGSLSRSVRTSSPSAVTSSIAVTLFACRPCLRPSQPRPPPSE